ncbi:MAG TPA: hypothetical protein VK420_09475, partial [Longimicrobium sp.]|nr:hypothetical protein [Longimicrobium sp.]
RLQVVRQRPQVGALLRVQLHGSSSRVAGGAGAPRPGGFPNLTPPAVARRRPRRYLYPLRTPNGSNG